MANIINIEVEDNNYYTPSLEEFHEGFEYYQYIPGSNTKYQKMIFSLSDVNFIVNCYSKNLQEGWVKVPCLNKKDIDDC